MNDYLNEINKRSLERQGEDIDTIHKTFKIISERSFIPELIN